MYCLQLAKARETSITLESALAILTEHASAEEFRRRLNMDLAAASEDNEDVMTVHVAMKQARPWLSAPKCAVLAYEITFQGGCEQASALHCCAHL